MKKQKPKSKNPPYRPPKFKTAEELYGAGMEYFNQRLVKDKLGIDAFVRPPTVTGLAMAIGLDRKGLISYSNKSEDFANAVKKLKQIIEEFLDESTHRSRNVLGVMFNLRANYGWQSEEDSETSKAIVDTMAAIRKILGG